MGYIAVKGGREAINNAINFMKQNRGGAETPPITVDQIKDQLGLAVDRIMGEGSVYAPNLAALALKQAAGDTLEAAFIMRAYRTTQPRVGYSEMIDVSQMRVIRRISAAFKEIPGGQVLGPTSDYTLRLLDFDLVNMSQSAHQKELQRVLQEVGEPEPLPLTFPKVVNILKNEDLLSQNASSTEKNDIWDITRNAVSFPAPRSAALQTMARGETGGLLALAYSNMRGYGSVHPTVGELRVGYLPLLHKNPYSKSVETLGEIKVTECEIIAHVDTPEGNPKFSIGYGICFGHNETKAISMAVLDRSIQSEEPEAPSEDQEFVLAHVDGIESMGFCNHFKLPHYVTFQSALDRLRKARYEHKYQGVAQPAQEPET
ncbi:MAG: carbon-phosphorus lyase complex subunit PhnI [Verrucomicrobiota bacterium]